MYEELYTVLRRHGVQCCDDMIYDPNKPRIKTLLWDHYDWFVEMHKAGKLRSCVLDNVQKTMLCNTFYLGFDVFECPNCENEMVFCRKCHSRFCTSNSVVSRHRHSGIFGTCPSLKSAPGTKNVQARGRAYAGKAIADRRTPCTLVKGVAKGHYFLQRLCISGVRGCGFLSAIVPGITLPMKVI